MCWDTHTVLCSRSRHLTIKVVYSDEEREKQVNLLTDVDVQFVSLVSRGANWTPFKVLKSDKTPDSGPDSGEIETDDNTLKSESAERDEEPSMVGQTIQSIILPNSEPWDHVKTDPQLCWIDGVNVVEKREYNAHVQHVSLPESAFVDGSFRSYQIGHGGLLVAGTLVSTDHVEKAGITDWPIPAESPGNDFSEPVQPVTTVGDMIIHEMDAFNSVMWAALRQTNNKPSARKQIVMNALGAFWDFLNGILDVAGADAITKSYTATGCVVPTKTKNEVRTMDDRVLAQVAKQVTELVTIVTDLQAERAAEKRDSVTVAVSPGPPVHGDAGVTAVATQGEVSALKAEVLSLRDTVDTLVHSVSHVSPGPDPAIQATQKSAGATDWSGAWA